MSVESDRRRLAERAREAGLAAAADRERRAAEAERPLAPGDLVLDRSTAELPVEWAVIDVEESRAGESAERGSGGGEAVGAGISPPGGDPTAPRRLLLVPVDSMSLRGPADVAVAEALDAGSPDAGEAAPAPEPLILRCGFGVWVESSRLDRSLRGGRLADDVVHEARERYREAAEAGGHPRGTPLEREAEADPDYRHWVETVLRPAREALAAVAAGAGVAGLASPGAGSAPASLGERRRRRPFAFDRPWAIAASVLLLIALGLVGGLLRQRQTLTELRTAERRLAQDLASVRSERDTLRGERERLGERIDRLAEEHRRELAERERRAQDAERGFLDRLADLQERLREATTPRAWVNLPFQYLTLVEPERGPPKAVVLPADTERLVLLLEYVEDEPFDSYRLELYREGEERPVWSADGLHLSGPAEFSVVLPARLLPPGRYRLELFGMRVGDGAENVGAYEVEVAVGN